MSTRTLSLPSRRVLAAAAVLGFCLVMTALGRGTGETYGVFLLPLSRHFGWERAAVTSVYSVYMLSLGLGSLLAGLAFDRFGARFNYMLGAALLATGYGLAGHLVSLWQFYLCVGVCGGVGAAMVGIIPTQSLVSRWFDRRLATALSIAYAGQGLGTLVMAPSAQIAIDRLGWSAAYGIAGWGFAGVLVFVTVLPWRRIAEGAANNPRKARGGRASGGPSLGEAVRSRVFWAFFFIFAATAVAIFGINPQVVAYLVAQGFSEVEAAFSFGVAGMLTFAGMALTGLAADRWPRHIVATVSYTLTFVGIGALALVQVWPSWGLVGLFVLGFGLSAGARGPIITTLMAELFAGRGLASIYGASNLGQGLGAAFGAIGSGVLYDATGGYNAGFAACAAFAAIGASLFWVVPEIRRGRARRT